MNPRHKSRRMLGRITWFAAARRGSGFEPDSGDASRRCRGLHLAVGLPVEDDLAEKAGQMTQVANTYITNKNDIATYGIGSILSGGGGGPNGAGGTATQWADMVDDFQSYALKSRLGIPLLYGVDAVHGNNNVQGAVIFPHNIGMGASRDTALVTQEEDVTRQEVLGTGHPVGVRAVRLRATRRPLGPHL